jgi:hypothetical protein
MNRQLRAEGGIMQVAPRENFGLGSKLKKFVRKIIPNEVADIAVKAAPFVAPFNPAVAAAMSGIGTFDQTGSIGDSLKGAGMNYAGGQAARYIGGAGFQGNPFGQGGAFTGSGFRGGFSSPLGTNTGLGKFFSNRGTEGVQGIDMTTAGADGVGVIPDVPTEALASELSYVPKTGIDVVTGGADGVGIIQDTIINKTTVAKEPGFLKNMFDGISNQDYGKVAQTIGEGAKKFGKAMFTNKDGSVDKAAVMGAIAFAGSYVEAKALAAETGIDPDLTEAEYDELARVDKQEEYASYLTNFFGGQKDGGRIGYKNGTIILGEDELAEMGGEQGLKLKLLAEKFMEDDGMSESDAYEKAANSLYAKGGRVSRKFGSPKEGESEVGIMTIDVEAGDDEDQEDMLMAYSDAIFDRREKSALFRSLGDPRIQQTTKSFKNLDKILKNPGMFPEDEFMLKEYLKLKGFKDGGRIGFALGTPKKDTTMFEKLKGDLIYRPDDKPTMPEQMQMPTDDKMVGANRVSELLILRDSLLANGEDVSDIEAEIYQLTGKVFQSVGGISEIPTGQMRKNNAGVVERDYRDEGGFVPVGIKERADDVPAMLSKNEFVMTADAVRGIGNGSVENGSKKLYNTMKQAEKVGKA